MTRMAHPMDTRPAADRLKDPAHGSQRFSRGVLVKIAAASLVTAISVAGWQMNIFAAAPATAPPLGAAPIMNAPILNGMPPSGTPMPSPSRPTDSTDPGFANPAVQCKGQQKTLAAGRTQNSLVVICIAPNGRLQYRGIRLSLGVGVQIDDVTVNAGSYVARNETVAYSVSPSQLVVTSKDGTVSREAMLDYTSASSVVTQPTALRPTIPTPLPAKPASPVRPQPSLPSAQRPMAVLDATSDSLTGTGKANVRFAATAPWQLRYSVRCGVGTPVGGFIMASGADGTDYYVALQPGTVTPEVASGWSLTKLTAGPIIVSINPFNQDCHWTLSLG